MRKAFFLCMFCCALFSKKIVAQVVIRSTANLYGEGASRNNDEVNRRGQLYDGAAYAIIDGQKVVGSPFWQPNWVAGLLHTADGRKISGFKFKYDIFYQTIQFLNGKDSLEMVEPTVELDLVINEGDSTVTVRFINSQQYDKKSPSVYYEVLLDDAKGQLMKLNQLKIEDLNEGLTVRDGKKAFKSANAYYYYDKQKQKLTKLKGGNRNILSAMNKRESD
ncbi:MAG: hypothetical protein ABW007_01275, partial [Chitinophagaceae bacterium]